MSKYKSNNGKYLSRQLFWEESVDLPMERRVFPPVFTLYSDRTGLVNFGKAYVASRDPTGYKVTQQLLEGEYAHWTVLLGCRWFVAAKELWDRELDALLQSEALEQIRLMSKEAETPPAQRLSAAKFMATQSYRKEKTTGRGRPRREDIDRAAKDLAASERELEEDLKRIKGAF